MASVTSPRGDLLRARAALEGDKEKAARIRADAKKADDAFKQGKAGARSGVGRLAKAARPVPKVKQPR